MSAGGKLVRDRIPEIIRASGAEPITYRAESAEYRRRLHDKRLEEVDEFLNCRRGDRRRGTRRHHRGRLCLGG